MDPDGVTCGTGITMVYFLAPAFFIWPETLNTCYSINTVHVSRNAGTATGVTKSQHDDDDDDATIDYHLLE